MSAFTIIEGSVFLTDDSGNPIATSNGQAVNAHGALLIAGNDGANYRNVRTATDGTVRTDPTGTTAQPVSQATAGNLNATAVQGTAASLAGAWPIKNTDGTNVAAVKAASTAAQVTDPALVVGISPNSPLPAGSNTIGTVTAVQPTASSLNATVVQGTASNLLSQVSQPTAASLNATVVQGTATNLKSQATQGPGAAASGPWSVELSDGSAFYVGAKTGQLPSALVGGRLDTNLGSWLGSAVPTVGQVVA